MKSIVKVLFLFMALILLFTQCEKELDPDDPVSIPDQSFLDALIELGVDTNEDGKISSTEAESIESLDVSYREISDMTGIEKFVNLDTLDCGGNQLISLDVSKNTLLGTLDCGENQLTSLDVSGSIALESLYCAENQLTNLDVSNCTSLTSLHCGVNQLTTLDISNNTAIGTINAERVRLDISSMPTLYEVCVWKIPFPPEGLVVDTTGSPNVYFTTECSE